MGCESLFKIDEAGLEFLKRDWDNLIDAYKADHVYTEQLFDQLSDLYSARGRAYHNLSHIHSLLTLCDSLREQIRNYDVVRFAVWFHDAIYNTRKDDNEELSADLAVQSMGRCKIDVESIKLVREMILATKGHRRPVSSEDVNIFLDLDLSILGSDHEVYQNYSKAIRCEYSWAPGFLYRRGRKKVLESFLEREAIYSTEVMARKYESQARKNIRLEIESLEN